MLLSDDYSPRRGRALAALLVGALFLGALLVGALFVSSCGAEETSQFGPVVSSVDELVGTELTANTVVSLPCIPSRRDPVGVWLAMQVHEAAVEADSFSIAVQETDARLGSHPSGCANPEVLLAQSVFLLDGDEAIFAGTQADADGITTLTFAFAGRKPSDLDLVVLPTFAFDMGDGNRQTTIFGLIGRYSLS